MHGAPLLYGPRRQAKQRKRWQLICGHAQIQGVSAPWQINKRLSRLLVLSERLKGQFIQLQFSRELEKLES